MLSFDDPRWTELTAGYRVPVDLRPLLSRLESGKNLDVTWQQIWQELYHQGNVGEGSYAAIPHVVRIHRDRGVVNWNTYALVATVELARGHQKNPDVPDWLRDAYNSALDDLAQLGLKELPHAAVGEAVRSILGLLAVVRSARVRAYSGRVLPG